jgi:hypothetical protein
MKITKDQEKGVKMLSVLLKKQYPFIIDVKINENDLIDYSTLITLKCVVDYNLIQKYFGQKMDYRWNEFFRFQNIFTNQDNDEKILEDIKDICYFFYETITDEFKFESKLSSIPFRKIKITSFLLQ